MLKSFCNPAIYKMWIKRYRSISVLMAFAFLVAGLVYHNTFVSGQYHSRPPFDSAYFIADASISVPLGLFVMAAALVMGIFCFRFLHDPRECDIMHALPPKRRAIFMSVTAAGLTLLVLPILFSALLFGFIMQVNGVFALLPILVYFLMLLSCAALAFGMAAFAAMLTGRSIVQGILVLLACGLPFALEVLVKLYVQRFFFGYNTYGSLWAENINPIYLLSSFLQGTSTSFHLGQAPALWGYIAFLLIGLALIGLSLLLYRRRPVESAGEVISLRALKPILRLLLGFLCAAALYAASILFIPAALSHILIELLVNIIGVFLGCWLCGMLLSRSIRVRLFTKEAICFAAALAVLMLCLHFDITGYSHAALSADNVTHITAFYPPNGVISAMQDDPAAQISSVSEYDLTDESGYLQSLHAGIPAKMPRTVADKILAQDARVYTGEDAADVILLQQMLAGLSNELLPTFNQSNVVLGEFRFYIPIHAKQENGKSFVRNYPFRIRPEEHPELLALIQKIERQNSVADISNMARVFDKAKQLELQLEQNRYGYYPLRLRPGEWDGLKTAYLSDMERLLETPPVENADESTDEYESDFAYMIMELDAFDTRWFLISQEHQSTVAWLTENGYGSKDLNEREQALTP